MSSFSRGISGFISSSCFRLPPSIRVTLLPSRTQSLNCSLRVHKIYLQSNLRQYATAKATPRGSFPPLPRTGGTSRYPSSNPVLRLVERTGKPILLYKAPDRGMMTLATFSAAFLLIGGGFWTMNAMYVHLPKEQPNWVRVTYGVIAFCLVALGTYVATTPVWRLRSIQAIPDTLGGPAMLRFEGKIIDIPMCKTTVTLARPKDCSLDCKIKPLVRIFRDVEEIRHQDITYGLEEKWRPIRPLLLFGRFVSRGLLRWFVNTRIAFTRFGIIHVDVKGDKWKIDATGWLLDAGKGLDSMISS